MSTSTNNNNSRAPSYQRHRSTPSSTTSTTPTNRRRRSTSPSTVYQPPHPPHQFTFAKRTLRKLVEQSSFFKGIDETNNVGTIHERDVYIGSLLGQGGFCEVRYCCAPRSLVDEEKVRVEMGRGGRGSGDGGSDNKGEGGLGENINNNDTIGGGNNNSTTEEGNTKNNNNNNNNTMARYAIKYLSPTRTAPHPSDPKNKVFQRGIADLAMEACFLSLLAHENIITCHYVSEGSLEENFNTDEDCDYDGGSGMGSGGAGGGMGRRGEKKRRFKEEIVTDAMGNLVLREVPIDDENGDKNVDGKKEGEEEQQQQEEDEKKSSYTHRFGYFLLLDVLHETLAHRIDHVYIPQVLLVNNGSINNTAAILNAAAAGGTSSSNGSVNSSGASSSLLLHTQEKRESFLKRMRRSPSSLLRRASHGSSSSGAPGVQSLQHSDHSHPQSSSNNVSTPSPYDYINNQKLKLASRLTSLLSIANALQYLHEHQILFRDIKPDNIGFYRDYSHICTCGKRPEATVKGTDVSMRDCTCYNEIPKLFDFGLAKELKAKYRVDPARYAARIGSSPESYSENKKYAHHSSHRGHGGGPGSGLRRAMLGGGGSSRFDKDDAVYKLTGCTGSRRYMAPEVCFNDPYNEKADVYSFGMMLYQVASLVTPFDGYSSYDHEKEVLRGGFRPDIELPTKKDILACKEIEQVLFTAGSGGRGSGGSGSGDEIEINSDDEEDYHRKKNNKKEGELPPPSEKRNTVLAIKSKSVWTKDLKRLIDECWDYDMRYRPTMKDVVVRLQGCIDDLLSSSSSSQQQQKKGKDSSELNDVHRGSRNIFMMHRQEGEEKEKKVGEGVVERVNGEGLNYLSTVKKKSISSSGLAEVQQ